MRLPALALAPVLIPVALAQPLRAEVTEGEVRAVASAVTAFGCDLYAQTKDAASPNLVVSPLSLSTALNMTSLGAAGATADAFAKTLHRPEVTTFHAIAGLLPRAFSKSKDVTVVTDNRLWVSSRAAVAPAFAARAAKLYGAAAAPVDFADAAATAKTVNAAVAKATGGKVAQILPAAAVSPDTRLLLTNTLYFRGDWAEPFAKAGTRKEPFKVSDTATVTAPTMHVTATVGHAEATDYTAVEIPFTGNKIALLVLVPREGKTLADVEAHLTPDHLSDLAARVADKSVALALPRFKVATTVDARKPLEALGLGDAFTPKADFSGLSAEPVFLSGAYQRAVLTVDEQGVEAAAATALAAAGAEPASPVHVAVDRPFLFLLLERNSRLPFFMGKVTDPTK